MELITVIIPVYNAEKTLDRCLKSIINQSYGKLEILIINDGSVDKTLDICEAYKKRDSRIKIFCQKNKGVSAARNLGIKNALGKYLAFVDADDYVEEEMIACLYQMYQDGKEVDLAICNCDIRVEKGYSIPEIKCKKIMSKVQTLRNMFGPQSVRGYLWNKLFRTDIVKKNRIMLDETIYISEDLLFCCQYGLYIREARYTDRRLYHYIMSFQGATLGNYSQKRFTEFYAFKKIKSILHQVDDKDLHNALDAEYMITCMRLMKKILKIHHSFRVEEMKLLITEIRSIGGGILYSDWSLKYKALYIPLKIFSNIYR